MDLTVNGRAYDVRPAPGERLLNLLRDQLHLTGAKYACGHGECGTCTVLVDGRLTYSCITLAEACAGASVTTVEGLADGAALSALQRAFVAHDAAQCGYCTPGQLVAATHLLAKNPAPDEQAIRTGMSGNLCRCGTYPKILSAIQAVARGEFRDAAAGAPAAASPRGAHGG
jgi:aerobic-type carbon monoxide dehydrogenase small subunit (CoxS/CutS family)